VTIANNAAQSAIVASCESLPKSTIFDMVKATCLFIIVIINTPKKLSLAAIITADLAEIALVETQVAIAFGASVQPFTRITPIVSIAVIRRAGLAINWLIKSNINLLPIIFSL
jgi:hypothetical protein